MVAIDVIMVPTYIYVELCPSSPVPNPFPFSLHMTDRRIGEAPTDGPSHDTQALDMPNDIGKHRKQQGNVRQSPSSHQPSCSFRLCQQRGTHGCNGRLISNRLSSGLWEKLRAIQARSP